MPHPIYAFRQNPSPVQTAMDQACFLPLLPFYPQRRRLAKQRHRAAAGRQEFLAVKLSLGFSVLEEFYFQRFLMQQCNISECLYYSLVLLSYTQNNLF